MSIANVILWGKTVGVVSLGKEVGVCDFEYDSDFVTSGIEPSPFNMPLSNNIYSFPALPFETFHGLPGLLVDSLPDDFGNAVINAWLAKEGRDINSFNAIERLCYTGNRGMGALEYVPANGPKIGDSNSINIDALVSLASEVLKQRSRVKGSLSLQGREDALEQILQIGTSAGGARAKAVIAWNEQTNEVRSGQIELEEGFTYWLLKFDGITGNKDKELDDPKGYGLIEYAYYEMARAAGIDMSECHLLKENGRNHFMTKRFDRLDNGEKLHVQSFGSLEHYDFKKAGVYSYDQLFQTIKKLDLSNDVVEQQFRRVAFNIIARNQDDHVKNIAFLMDKAGNWSLSPAFDITYNYNPNGAWTSTHQMSMNGKRDGFDIEDFRQCAKRAFMKRGRAEEILEDVSKAVLRWEEFASNVGVSTDYQKKIANVHRVGVL